MSVADTMPLIDLSAGESYKTVEDITVAKCLLKNSYNKTN